jgi:hypothetical protein
MVKFTARVLIRLVAILAGAATGTKYGKAYAKKQNSHGQLPEQWAGQNNKNHAACEKTRTTYQQLKSIITILNIHHLAEAIKR